MTEQESLAGALMSARKLTKFYLGMLLQNEINPLIQVQAGTAKLNSMIWLCGHVAWAEHSLIPGTLCEKPLPHEWLTKFAFNTQSDADPEWPEFSDVLSAMDVTHAATIEAVKGLTELDSEAYVDFMDWKTTRRNVVYHAIRHEGNHAGHFGWLCKIHGIKTI